MSIRISWRDEQATDLHEQSWFWKIFVDETNPAMIYLLSK